MGSEQTTANSLQENGSVSFALMKYLSQVPRKGKFYLAPTFGGSKPRTGLSSLW